MILFEFTYKANGALSRNVIRGRSLILFTERHIKTIILKVADIKPKAFFKLSKNVELRKKNDKYLQ